MAYEITPQSLAEFFETVDPHLAKPQRRIVAAALAKAIGRGGIGQVARSSTLSRSTIHRSIITQPADAAAQLAQPPSRTGRPTIHETEPLLDQRLGELTQSMTGAPYEWIADSVDLVRQKLITKGSDPGPAPTPAGSDIQTRFRTRRSMGNAA